MSDVFPDKIDCRMCGGKRPHDGKRCLGCGTPVANAVRKPKPVSPNRTPGCPRCGAQGPHKELEADRWCCTSCSSVFEKLEPVAQVIVDASERKMAAKQRGGKDRRYR